MGALAILTISVIIFFELDIAEFGIVITILLILMSAISMAL